MSGIKAVARATMRTREQQREVDLTFMQAYAAAPECNLHPCVAQHKGFFGCLHGRER